MKTGEPISVQINTLPGRDWPQAWLLSFLAQHPRGGTESTSSTHWFKRHSPAPPTDILALPMANLLPLALTHLVFPSARKGNIPLRSAAAAASHLSGGARAHTRRFTDIIGNYEKQKKKKRKNDYLT